MDPTFDKRLQAAYDAAKERGLWKNTYAMTNHSEYWAEAVQSWFDDNARPNAIHNDIRTRAKLKEYDKEVAKLCEEVFGDKEWRYLRPAKRKAEDVKHLTNFDAKKLPRFVWREAPIGDKPRATIQTASGEFSVANVTSRPVRHLLYDLEPAKVLTGFAPQDQWPTGSEEF